VHYVELVQRLEREGQPLSIHRLAPPPTAGPEEPPQPPRADSSSPLHGAPRRCFHLGSGPF
jgi:hypothetical protein